MKRFIAILMAAAMLFALAACGSDSAKNNVDADGNHALSSNGITITLPADYYVYDQLDKTVYPDIATAFTNNAGDVAIYVISEKFTELGVDSSFTADDYLDAQHENSTGMITSVIKEEDGVRYYTYTYMNTEEIKDIVTLEYLNVAYKSSDAFWMVQFCCAQSDFDKKKPDFLKWAKTVTF